jgi:hypothetical protein
MLVGENGEGTILVTQVTGRYHRRHGAVESADTATEAPPDSLFRHVGLIDAPHPRIQNSHSPGNMHDCT